MNSAIMTLLSISLSGTTVALLIFILKPLLNNKVSKSYYYYLWLLVLFRLIIPFGYEISIQSTHLSHSVNSSEIISAIQQQDLNSDNNLEKNTKQQSEVSDNNVGSNVANSSNDYGRRNIWLFMQTNALIIWISGIAVSIGWYLIAYSVFLKRIRRSIMSPCEDDFAIFEKLKQGKNVHFACSKYINTPMLIGIFTPTIALPEFSYSANGMSTDLGNILRHELAHYSRHDIAYKWLVIIITSIHWFNPFMYLIRREIGNACELACDEAIIKRMDTTERQSYGNTLLSLANKKQHPAGVVATTMSEDKKRLKGRLIGIMNYGKKPRYSIVIMVTIALLLSCFAIVMASADDREKHAEESTDDDLTTLSQNTSDNNFASQMPSGETRSFSYGDLKFELTNVATERQESINDDGGHTHEITVITYHVGAKLSVVNADVSEPTYSEDGLAHPQWAIMLSTGETIKITEDIGPLDIIPSAEGIYNLESSQVVFRLEQAIPNNVEFENGEQYLETVLESSLFLDCTTMTTEEFQKEYAYELAFPNYLPEQYSLYDRVFIWTDPLHHNQFNIKRLWYDPDNFNTLVISQLIPGVSSGSDGEFVFTGSDELGQSITTWFSWANYYGSYELTDEKNGHVQGYMLVNDSTFKEECKNILTSIRVE